MSDTLGSLRQEILLELRGDLQTAADVALINAKINNALEAVWMAMMKVALARFFGSDSPVSFTIASGSQRTQLVSIPDPTVAPVIAAIAGGNLAQRTILGAYTYVTESGSETNLSPTFAVVIPLSNLGQVAAPPAVSQALGWNFYASVTNNAALMALQNQQPLPFVVPYNEPATGWQDYSANEQTPPSSNQTADNISFITHLEITMPDTTLKAWNQEDIDSLAMRGLAGTKASASPYQTYAWDLINGRTIEVRPQTGSAFNPRYFYVAKPRRLRYDQAEIPYSSISGVHEFLTNTAIGDLKLVLDEYISAQAYQGKAGSVKGDILTSLAQENWAKNNRVTPFLY